MHIIIISATLSLALPIFVKFRALLMCMNIIMM